MSRGKSSPIHDPEQREKLLEHVRRGGSPGDAQLVIGCHERAVRRMMASDDAFRRAMEAAVREGAAARVEVRGGARAVRLLAPRARVVLDAEPVDMPGEGDGPTGSEPLGVDEYLGILAAAARDPYHPGHRVALAIHHDILTKAASVRMIKQAEREAAELDDGGRQLVVVIRVPGGAGG